MAGKEEALAAARAVVDAMENVVAAVQKACETVDEAIETAAGAFGDGVNAGSDVDIIQSLVALKFLLEEEAVVQAHAAASAARESERRHK